MLSVSLPFRKAIVAAIGTIQYMGVTVFVWDSYNNGPQAELPIGNNIKPKAWIRLLSQTADDDSPKCMRSDMASIQIQVQVSFGANSGNYEHSEEIMNLILAKLFSGNSGIITIESPFSISLLDKVSERNLDFQDQTNRIYMKSCTITAKISQ